MFSDKVPDNPKFLGILGQFIPLNVSFKDKGENSDQQAESVSVPVPAQEVPPPALAPECQLQPLPQKCRHQPLRQGQKQKAQLQL